MNVLLITNSKISSGAGILAEDFANAFRKKGVNVKILVNQYSGESDYVINVQSPAKTKFISLLRRLIYNNLIKNRYLKWIFINRFFRFSNGLVFKSIHRTKYFVQDVDQTKNIYTSRFLYEKVNHFKPDAVLVLFMQNFVSYKNLYDLKHLFNHAPICISMVDMAPITGGCHYAWNCTGYQTDCNNCPAVPKQYQDQIIKNLEFKSNYSQAGNFHFFYSSESQILALKKSKIAMNNPKHKIALPIDDEKFNNNITLRDNTRKSLEFEDDDMVMLLGAMDLLNPRKGGSILFKLIEKIVDDKSFDDLKFLVIGGNSGAFEKMIPKERLKSFEVVSPHDLPQYYNAADFFLSPSVADAGPMMVNQSIMCGTRTCSFTIGVAIDLIENNPDCGRCTKTITPEALLDLVVKEVFFQKHSNRIEAREKCAIMAHGQTSSTAVSERWIHTINTIILQEKK